ncbi:MAG: hypothetical protein NVS1B3_08570 [Candidatus Dormibacteraceae bacterium]
MKVQVICLPGGVAPATQRYAPLIAAVDQRAELHVKDLEVYRTDMPPSDYKVELELSAVDRFADSLGLARFHLVGYSGGGFISLAYAGTRPHRLQSLALFEPAGIPGPMTTDERSFFNMLQDRLRGLEGAEFMAAFVREQVKPGVVLPAQPPVGGLPNRPGGIAALMRSFDAYQFDRDQLRAVTCPVYVGYGDLTHGIESTRAGILARLFSDARVQRHGGIHHFVPPEQIYTPAHVRSLLELWHRADNSESAG